MSPSSDAQVIGGLIGRHRKGLAFGGTGARRRPRARSGYAWWRRAANASLDSQAAAPSNVVIQPQTFTGNARLGVISPDGKFVAYVRSDEQSLWVRQTSTGNDVRIVPNGSWNGFLGL